MKASISIVRPHSVFSVIFSLLFFLLSPPPAARAQGTCISLTASGSAYTQDFNTLSNVAGSTTNNLTIPGWYLTESGGGGRDNEQYAVGTGSDNTGDVYSYGAAGSSERALGSLRTGTSLIPIFGACFTNHTGSALTRLDVAYIGEEWRLGAAARPDQIDFEYSTNATNLITGTWTAVPGLNFVTPDTVTVGAKNGNAAADRNARSATLTGLAIANGSTFWIRWTDRDINGFDDGLAVDDFSLRIQDSTAPALLSFTRQTPATSPTRADTVIFRATFSEDVQNLLDATADFIVDGATTAIVTGVAAADARTWDVTVSGGDLAAFSGIVGLNLAGGQNITDLAGNALAPGEPAIDQTYMLDNTQAAVISILRQDPLASPTNLTSITFRLTFDEDVQNVDTPDFIPLVTDTATGTISSVIVQSASTYDVVLTGVGGNGVLDLNFSPGNDIADLTGNPLGASPATGTEQTYTIDTSPPTVLYGGSTAPEQNSTLLAGPTRLVIQFSEDVIADRGIHAANTPGNYLLVEEGANGTFDTSACGSGWQTDDLRIALNSVAYSNGGGLFLATLNINNGAPLPTGSYRLFICGTASIHDLAGNRLNNGIDSLLNFRVGRMNVLPGTGFAPNRVTSLAPQTILYTDLGSLWLEIPKLGLKMPIVGVPKTKDGWNVSWLGSSAGWLEGSAYPSWNGNSVITGHVWNADNSAGPFVYLNTLWWGDKIIVHLAGQQYIYEVRSVKQVTSTNTKAVLKHEELPWLTLVTCKSYDEATDSYRYRILVRAVLVEVK